VVIATAVAVVLVVDVIPGGAIETVGIPT